MKDDVTIYDYTIRIENKTYYDIEPDLFNYIKELKEENQRLNNVLKILEKYFELIYDLGFDYDGLNTVESLKGLIDEMTRLASLGRTGNTTDLIYVNDNKKYNILGEKLKESDK